MQPDPIRRQLARIKRLGNRSYHWLRGRIADPQTLEKEFRAKYFADEVINLDVMTQIRHEHFPVSGPIPWLDAEKVAHLPEDLRAWRENGYLILENAVDAPTLDRMWSAYEHAIRESRVTPEPEDEVGYPGRLLNPHLDVPEFAELLHLPLFTDWVSRLLGRPAVPYQTIAAHRGSEQLEHSDIIHMSTYPLGYLVAIWVAFEDIHPDSGPLVYYPGSHKLPYYFSQHVGIAPGEFGRRGYPVYSEKYEPFIQRLIQEKQLKPAYFSAKKGDAFIWHANLIHGGSPRKNRALSRKSVVCHYFGKGAVCYHDLSGGLASDFSSFYNA